MIGAIVAVIAAVAAFFVAKSRYDKGTLHPLVLKHQSSQIPSSVMEGLLRVVNRVEGVPENTRHALLAELLNLVTTRVGEFQRGEKKEPGTPT
jgi:hypothetical protein